VSAVDAPVRAFLDRLSSLGSDVAGIGRALAELAADADYFAPMIAEIDPLENGGAALHVPERGPRLFFLHRPRGVMSAVHSHGTWIAVACVAGVETHRRYSVVDSVASVAEEVRLGPGEVVALTPPDDVHSHGHTLASGEAVPYSLILTGDDQLLFPRREYDVPAGRYRDLPPGDFGSLNLPAEQG
jgi:predicted metal-dependent enzyme (double-stranded beta helix superfamily)